MRKIVTYIYLTLGLGGIMWFIATIDSLNFVPVIGLMVAGVCLPTAYFTASDDMFYIDNDEEGDEEDEWQYM